MLVAHQQDPLRVLALDIDGVITDGSVELASLEESRHGRPLEHKRIVMRDLDALTKLRQKGFLLGLVTGEKGPMVDAIAARLTPDAVIAGAKDKRLGLIKLCEVLDCRPSEVCFVGDAERDALAFQDIGLSLAPSDADPLALAQASRVLGAKGGAGAVSHAVSLLLELQRSPTRRAANLERTRELLRESQLAHEEMARESAEMLVEMGQVITRCFERGGKVVFLGNGGSAADAQHAAAELMGRFRRDRRPLPALALSTDTSVLTCIANDWEYDEVFARQVRGLCRPNDVVIGLSTSGRSENVRRALEAAREMGAHALALTGKMGGPVEKASHLCLKVPSGSTPRIQELHTLALHTICDLVEADLFP